MTSWRRAADGPIKGIAAHKCSRPWLRRKSLILAAPCASRPSRPGPSGRAVSRRPVISRRQRGGARPGGSLAPLPPAPASCRANRIHRTRHRDAQSRAVPASLAPPLLLRREAGGQPFTAAPLSAPATQPRGPDPADPARRAAAAQVGPITRNTVMCLISAGWERESAVEGPQRTWTPRRVSLRDVKVPFRRVHVVPASPTFYF